MNCQKIDELMPLFAGGDLDGADMQAIASHLETCAGCRLSENGYRAAMLMISAYEPPRFSETVLADMRRRVLAEIEQSSRTPLFASLVEMVRLPYLWPAAAAVLIIITLLALMQLIPRSSGGANLADRREAGETVEPPQTEQLTTPSKRDGQLMALGTDSTNGQQRIARKRPAVKRFVADKAIAASPRKTTRVAQTPAPENVASLPANYPDTDQPVMRVEMQTKDPNIRIIWFSKQPN